MREQLLGLGECLGLNRGRKMCPGFNLIFPEQAPIVQPWFHCSFLREGDIWDPQLGDAIYWGFCYTDLWQILKRASYFNVQFMASFPYCTLSILTIWQISVNENCYQNTIHLPGKKQFVHFCKHSQAVHFTGNSIFLSKELLHMTWSRDQRQSDLIWLTNYRMKEINFCLGYL